MLSGSSALSASSLGFSRLSSFDQTWAGSGQSVIDATEEQEDDFELTKPTLFSEYNQVVPDRALNAIVLS